MAREREGRREERGREADALQHRGRVVLDVGLEDAARLELGEDAQHDVLDLDRELEPFGLAAHPLGDLAQSRRARVVGAVDAMAEAHDPLAAADELADPRLGPLGRADLVELVHDLRRRPAVERALQRADRAARPPTTMSERVDVMTRAVNVEALRPCSAPTMK